MCYNTYRNETWIEAEKLMVEIGSIYSMQKQLCQCSFRTHKDVMRVLVCLLYVTEYNVLESFRGLTTNKGAEKIKEEIILNSLDVLLKRGIKGLYLYCHDKKLERKLIEIIDGCS